MPDVLITGASGFIGQHVRQAFELVNWNVYRLPHSDIPGYGMMFGGLDAIVHLATNHGRCENLSRLEDVLVDNVNGPLRLLERAIVNKVPLFIAADTALPEDSTHMAPYVLSKKTFAKWATLACQGTSTRFLNVKLHYVYGEGDHDGKFIHDLIRQCLSNQDIPLTPGQQYRDFIHVSDVASAFLTLAERGKELCGEGESVTLDCGTGYITSIEEVATIVRCHTRSTSKLLFGALPYRSGEPMAIEAFPYQLRKLGWLPKTLSEGLRQTIEAEIAVDIKRMESCPA
jgi:nucleoside-diphosphate-sugar epimerase